MREEAERSAATKSDTPAEEVEASPKAPAQGAVATVTNGGVAEGKGGAAHEADESVSRLRASAAGVGLTALATELPNSLQMALYQEQNATVEPQQCGRLLQELLVTYFGRAWKGINSAEKGTFSERKHFVEQSIQRVRLEAARKIVQYFDEDKNEGMMRLAIKRAETKKEKRAPKHEEVARETLAKWFQEAGLDVDPQFWSTDETSDEVAPLVGISDTRWELWLGLVYTDLRDECVSEER